MAVKDAHPIAGRKSNNIGEQSTADPLNRKQDRPSPSIKTRTAPAGLMISANARSIARRASELSALQENLGRSIHALLKSKAGISAIASLIGAAKNIALNAKASRDAESRASCAAQFDALHARIVSSAASPGCRVTNLPEGGRRTAEVAERASFALPVAVSSFAAELGGLNIDAAGTGWTEDTAGDAAIDAAVRLLDAAAMKLRTRTAFLSADLTSLSIRRNFTTQMVNTLAAGSGRMTLADRNKEGASLLMLQSRQAFGMTAMSLSAQAAGSVLRLF